MIIIWDAIACIFSNKNYYFLCILFKSTGANGVAQYGVILY